jgi:hypothetical protein
MQHVLLLIVFVVTEMQGRRVVDREVVGLGVLPEEGRCCRGDP